MNLTPNRAMLLVIDMQKDFYGRGGNTDARGKSVKHMRSLPSKINAFAKHVRELGVRVVFTQFVYDSARSPSNYAEIVRSAKNNNWLCVKGTAGAELEGMIVGEKDVVIEKLTYDCFAGTELLQLARSWGIEDIMVCGVRTEVCIVATANRSFAEGFRTFVLSDLIGTQDEKMPITNAIMDALRYTSRVTTSREILQKSLGLASSKG
jgi:nicotinamidase-related amidase